MGVQALLAIKVHVAKLSSPELWFTVIHHWGAMFIAAALCLMLLGIRQNKNNPEADRREW